MFADGLFDGKRVLVTGGGTGLGRAMGERLAALGADLVICGRRKAPLEDTLAAIERVLARKVDTYALDIRSAS